MMEQIVEDGKLEGCRELSELYRGYCGLINQGATCFLNTVLQTLYMTKEFREDIKRNVSSDGNFIEELKKLFNELDSKQGPVSTTGITQSLDIDVCKQQDAAECLEMILRKTPDFSKIFTGTMQKTRTCKSCEGKKSLQTKFFSIAMSFEESQDVEDALKVYFKPTQQNGLYCLKCEEMRIMETESDIIHFPKVLIVQLRRLETTKNQFGYRKNQLEVSIHSHIKVSSHKYELYAIINHYGTYDGGHYNVDIKSENGNWYHFDDYLVQQSDIHLQSSVHSSSCACLLAYKRCEQGGDSSGEIKEAVSSTEKPERSEHQAPVKRPKSRTTGEPNKKIFQSHRSDRILTDDLPQQMNTDQEEFSTPNPIPPKYIDCATRICESQTCDYIQNMSDLSHSNTTEHADTSEDPISHSASLHEVHDDDHQNCSEGAQICEDQRVKTMRSTQGCSTGEKRHTSQPPTADPPSQHAPKNKTQRDSSDNQIGYFGLMNQGVNSYLNTVLQSLYMTKEYREHVERMEIAHDSSDQNFTKELKKLFNQLDNQQNPVSITGIMKSLGITHVHEEQDAAEYLYRILSKTPECFEMFKGTMKTACITCNKESEVLKHFWSISISFKDKQDVEDALETELRAVTQEYSDRCEKNTNMMMNFSKILIVKLMRFASSQRNESEVIIRPHIKVSSVEYELYVIINHNDTHHDGHYNADIKSDNQWFRFDDSRVSQSRIFRKEKSVYRSSSAYLLMYKRSGPTGDSHTDVNRSVPERCEDQRVKTMRSTQGCSTGEKTHTSQSSTEENLSQHAPKITTQRDSSDNQIAAGDSHTDVNRSVPESTGFEESSFARNKDCRSTMSGVSGNRESDRYYTQDKRQERGSGSSSPFSTEHKTSMRSHDQTQQQKFKTPRAPEDDSSLLLDDQQRMKITQVREAVPGVTDEEVTDALQQNNWDSKRAQQQLKIYLLYQMIQCARQDISRQNCEEILVQFNWDLEKSSSYLQDNTTLMKNVEGQ